MRPSRMNSDGSAAFFAAAFTWSYSGPSVPGVDDHDAGSIESLALANRSPTGWGDNIGPTSSCSCGDRDIVSPFVLRPAATGGAHRAEATVFGSGAKTPVARDDSCRAILAVLVVGCSAGEAFPLSVLAAILWWSRKLV